MVAFRIHKVHKVHGEENTSRAASRGILGHCKGPKLEGYCGGKLPVARFPNVLYLNTIYIYITSYYFKIISTELNVPRCAKLLEDAGRELQRIL